MTWRTDQNNNPTAFTTDLAREAGLIEGTDYAQGEPFTVGSETYYTAKILGDPIDVTIRLIDKVGFYTEPPHQRWTYIAIPFSLWRSLSTNWKIYTIGFMYQNEGGQAMKDLFVAPINVGVSSSMGLADKVNG